MISVGAKGLGELTLMDVKAAHIPITHCFQGTDERCGKHSPNLLPGNKATALSFIAVIE